MKRDSAIVTIVIVTWESRELLGNCLKSLEQLPDVTPFHVVVVDNGSSDGTAGFVRSRFPWVQVIESGGNVGFARGNNLVLRGLASDYAFLLNPDTLAKPGVVDRLVAFMRANPDCAAAGPRVVGDHGQPVTTYGDFPTPASAIVQQMDRYAESWVFRPWYRMWGRTVPADQTAPFAVDYTCGAAMMIRHEALQDVGLISEDFFLFFEEVDWCRRAKDRGWRRSVVPSAEVTHLEGGTMASTPDQRTVRFYDSMVIYLARWYGLRAALRAVRMMSWVWGIRRLRLRLLGKTDAAARADAYRTLFARLWRSPPQQIPGID